MFVARHKVQVSDRTVQGGRSGLGGTAGAAAVKQVLFAQGGPALGAWEVRVHVADGDGGPGRDGLQRLEERHVGAGLAWRGQQAREATEAASLVGVRPGERSAVECTGPSVRSFDLSALQKDDSHHHDSTLEVGGHAFSGRGPSLVEHALGRPGRRQKQVKSVGFKLGLVPGCSFPMSKK